MPHLTVTRTIAAPPQRVFEAAADFRGAPGRISGIKRIEMLTDGAVRVGTRFRETRVMFGREATETMEVVAFDSPRSYTLGCESHGCRYRSEFRFTPSGGGTAIEMTFDATPLTRFAKVMGFLMAPMAKSVARCVERDLDDLKAWCSKASPPSRPADARAPHAEGSS